MNVIPFKPIPSQSYQEIEGVIRTFVRGGLPGQARLQRVLPSLFKHYKIVAPEKQRRLLIEAGLRVFENTAENEKLSDKKKKKVRVKYLTFWLDYDDH